MLVDLGGQGAKDVLDPEVSQKVHVDLDVFLLSHWSLNHHCFVDCWEGGLVENGRLVD